jgi:hypothetical protein
MIDDDIKISVLKDCNINPNAINVLDDIHLILISELYSQKLKNKQLITKTTLLTKWLLFFVKIFSIAHRNLSSPYVSRLSLINLLDEVIEGIKNE